MEKDLKLCGQVDISSEENFKVLCHAFSHAFKAVEAQGYAAQYAGDTLYHPGQIGVIGPPAVGKSTFFNAAVRAYFPSDVQTSDQYIPSHDRKRNVLAWKEWLSNEHGGRQVLLSDMMVLSSMNIIVPERKFSGVSIFEHVSGDEGNLDMLLRFRYEQDGARKLDIHVTDSVAQQPDFKEKFLPVLHSLG